MGFVGYHDVPYTSRDVRYSVGYLEVPYATVIHCGEWGAEREMPLNAARRWYDTVSYIGIR